jgi:hypothetical protein
MRVIVEQLMECELAGEIEVSESYFPEDKVTGA